VRLAPPCRLAAWFVSFVLALVLVEVLARFEPRSIPWTIVTVAMAAAFGAAALPPLERLCLRIIPGKCRKSST
jgi:hypothetical protein